MAQELVKELESRYGTTPDIYFSGNKGYHVIMPVEIHHAMCHYVVMTMIQGYGFREFKNIDRKVYRNRAMLRLNKSPASKDGFYKIRLSRADLFDHDTETHRQFATNNTADTKSEFDPAKFNQARWDEDVALAIKVMGNKADEYSKATITDKRIRPWTPCLQGLLVNEPAKGERHSASFLLSRWAMQAGIDEEQALASFMQHQHWKDFETEERGVTKNLRSVYKSGRVPTLGCKYPGIDRDMMKRHCDFLCEYNDDWSLFG
jgi:hypothetical protein